MLNNQYSSWDILEIQHVVDDKMFYQICNNEWIFLFFLIFLYFLFFTFLILLFFMSGFFTPKLRKRKGRDF